jgi:hypothetical protein
VNQNFFPADETQQTYSLLSVISDPAKHKQRLDQLVEHAKAVDEKIAEHHELTAKTRGMHSAAQATDIVLNNRKAALDAREAEIEGKAEQLNTDAAMRSDTALRRTPSPQRSLRRRLQSHLQSVG